MKDIGKPTNSLKYDIGDLGESELLMELHSNNPNNRTAAVIGVAERFDDEPVLAILLRMKINKTNYFTLNEIEKTIDNIIMKKIIRITQNHMI